MNYLLHCQRSPGAVVPIPDDLEDMMSELSREVLRAQPRDVVAFLADYLEEKLAQRENRRLAEKVVDNVLDVSLDIVAMLESVGIDPSRAEAAVKRIRQEFHRHFETKPDDERLRETFRERDVLERLVKECHFTEQEARKASTIIEQAYRTYYFRNAYKEPYGPATDKDWRQAAKHTLSVYAQTGPTKEEMEAAATRIQAAYRAYYSRKKEHLDRKAAIIQRAVRSHQRRREVYRPEPVRSVVIAREILGTGVPEEEPDEMFSPSEEIRQLIDVAVGGEDPRDPMDSDEAATLIQSVFRGRLARKHIAPEAPAELGNTSAMDEDQAATLLQSTIRGHLVRRKAQQEKHEHAMATVLQSHARGFLARKKLHPSAPEDVNP